jgi:hypothetical protein
MKVAANKDLGRALQVETVPLLDTTQKVQLCENLDHLPSYMYGDETYRRLQNFSGKRSECAEREDFHWYISLELLWEKLTDAVPCTRVT